MFRFIMVIYSSIQHTSGILVEKKGNLFNKNLTNYTSLNVEIYALKEIDQIIFNWIILS